LLNLTNNYILNSMSNLINKAYKFRFYPQNDLKVILAKTFGCSRFVYNKTLAFSETHTYHDRDENACINYIIINIP